MRITVVTFLFFLFPAAAAAQQPDAKAVDAVVEDALKYWQVPGCSVAIVKGDQVIHLKGYGVRELGKKEPVTPESPDLRAAIAKALAN